MTRPPDRPARASIAHVWTRVFLWLFPGLCVMPLLCLNELGSTMVPLPSGILDGAAFACFLLILVVCALYDALLHLTRIHGGENVSRRSLLKFSVLFLFVQIPLVPAITMVIITFFADTFFRFLP